MGKTIVFTVINDLRSDQRMDKICTSLQSHGFEVTLVGRRLPDSPPLSDKPYQQIRIPCFFTKGKAFYIEYNLKLRSWLREHRFDIYSAVDADTIWPCVSAAKKHHVPVVYDAHEYFSEVPEVIQRPRVQQFWKWWEQLWIPKVQAAYTVSSGIQQILSAAHNIPFRLIRNVPAYYLPNTHHAVSEKYILYQGALNAGRGLEHIIRAMHHVPAVLQIVGEGDLSEALRKLVKAEQLQHKVVFVGFIPPDQLKTFTTQAYMGINVSESLGLSYYHSLNNKFFDYIMAGLPAITNDFPEYRAHMSQYETGILISDADPISIANACNTLLTDSQLHAKLKQNCLTAALEWNWEQEELQLLEIYRSIS
jgi:glycosyltransferase involved in cell wall biosynthesis